VSDADLVRWRLAKLREEVIHENIPIRDDDVGQLILEEILYARFIKVHEGIRPPYGALITTRDGIAKLEVTPESGDPTLLRPFADGQTALLLRDAGQADAGRIMRVELFDELAALRLARLTNGTVVQRHESGTITVTDEHAIFINEMFDWRKRPVASDWMFEARDYLGLSGELQMGLFARLLDFCFHQLSPRRIGATLVLKLFGGEGHAEFQLDHEGYEAPLAVNFMRDSDSQVMSTFLRIVDGACIVELDGRLSRTQAKLAVEKSTSALLGPDKGMRHSSAKWFSFKHPAVVVFVVSADGPVSIYSDGLSMNLHERFDNPEPSAMTISRDQVDGLAISNQEVLCGKCGRHITIRIAAHPDSEEVKVVTCPICSHELLLISAFWVRATPLKNWTSPTHPTARSAAPASSPPDASTGQRKKWPDQRLDFL